MIEDGAQTIALGRQLVSAAGMMLVMTVTHALGLTAISKALRLRSERLKEMSFGWRGIALMAGMASLLLVLHTLEIAIFAAFYLWVDALNTVEEPYITQLRLTPRSDAPPTTSQNSGASLAHLKL